MTQCRVRQETQPRSPRTQITKFISNSNRPSSEQRKTSANYMQIIQRLESREFLQMHSSSVSIGPSTSWGVVSKRVGSVFISVICRNRSTKPVCVKGGVWHFRIRTDASVLRKLHKKNRLNDRQSFGQSSSVNFK